MKEKADRFMRTILNPLERKELEDNRVASPIQSYFDALNRKSAFEARAALKNTKKAKLLKAQEEKNVVKALLLGEKPVNSFTTIPESNGGVQPIPQDGTAIDGSTLKTDLVAKSNEVTPNVTSIESKEGTGSAAQGESLSSIYKDLTKRERRKNSKGG